MFEIRAKLIKGFPVVDLEDGSMAGRVQNLILDPAGKKVAGFLVGEKGLLKGRPQIILYEQVAHVGRDAITIANKENPAAKEELPPEQEICRDYSFLGNSVISSAGDYIARVQDFTFSIQTGEIESLLLYDFRSREKIDKNIYLDIRGVQKLGKDYVIAEANYTDFLNEEEEERREDEERGQEKETAYSLEMRAIEFALHKEAAFTVRNLHGEIIVEKGRKITYDTIERARASGKLYQVLFAAGAGELLDSIDFTLEKLDQGGDRLLQAWHNFKKKSAYVFKGAEYKETEKKEPPAAEEEYKPGEIQRSLAEAFDNIKEIWGRLEREISREGKELALESREKMKAYALNKKAYFSIKNGGGEILLQRGEIITEEIIAAAETANKIPSLFLAAISREAEDSLTFLGEKIKDIFH